MDLTASTRRELAALNHTVAPEQIMSYLLESVSLERLHDLLEEKDQVASQPSQGGETEQSEQPLFFIDTGAKSQQRDIVDDRSTDDSENTDEEGDEDEDEDDAPMQFFD